MDRSPRNTPSPIGKGFFHALAALIALALVAGCVGRAPAPTASPTPTFAVVAGSPTPTGAETATGAADFPRTLVDDEGRTVELARQPQRVISLAPSFTEIVFALGAGDRLVGATDYEDYPPAAAELPDVAGFTGVIVERVVELGPDLVLAGGNNLNPPADIARLRELGYPVLVTYPPTVADVLDDIRLIGQALGEEDAADTLSAQMAARIEQVEAAVEAFPRARVFYEIGYEPDIYGPAPESFVADMVELAGGEPITTTDPAVFAIPLERLVTLDPEVIVLGDARYGVCPDAVRQRAGWSGMTAVRTGAIRPVDDVIVTRPGPRLAEGLAALALAIHPTAAIEPPEEAAALCE
ncbi:MAG: helical backbone metal receptor [Chloroflexota bacterium]|nr:helical backbone metal receptor [Chloroflexota bacterium]